MAPRYALSDSEAESEPDQSAPPSDDALEKALRDTVADIYKKGNMEELTVKRVRLAAEKSLELEPGFFKADSAWKAKSEQIIREAVESHDNASEQSNDDEEEKKAPSPRPAKSKPAKRTKPDVSAPRKRRKVSTPDPDEDNEDKEDGNEDQNEDQGSDAAGDESEEKVKKPAKESKAKQGKKAQPKPKGKTVEESDDAKEQDSKSSEEPKGDARDDSESEMSVVLDEEPQPTRKRQKSSEAAAPKGKKKAAAKPKDADLDPNDAEIKRLQGWLVKCGIRKMWWRELAPYDTPKAKIKHLKEMLKDAGMEGRYSVDKANRIREERELRADLELVQEGAKRWGTGSGDEGSDSAQPRRRLNRGRKTLAFLDSDGEETD